MDLTSEGFGPAKRLHAAIRQRAPQLAACVLRNDESGLSHVRVTGRDAVPRVVMWTGRSYQWCSESGPWERLPADPAQAASEIAEQLGAVTPSAEPDGPADALP
ncbi:hypothetical protein [Actinomadura sp. 3N508]|uniref:hypothetical protein n=1 Tax=Actinomadura sp. 3N508 TaxID=3375153 RepID=UPI00379AFC3A